MQQQKFALNPSMKVPKAGPSRRTISRIMKVMEKPDADGNSIRFTKKAQTKDRSRADAECSVSCAIQQAAVTTAAFTLPNGSMLLGSHKIGVDFTHATFNMPDKSSGAALASAYPSDMPLSVHGKLKMGRAYPIAMFFPLNGCVIFPPFVVFSHHEVKVPFLVRVAGLNAASDIKRCGYIYCANKKGTMMHRFHALFDDVMVPEIKTYILDNRVNCSETTVCIVMDGQWEQLVAAQKHHGSAGTSAGSSSSSAQADSDS